MSIRLEREADLKIQRQIFEKSKYDGHNRNSGITTMRDLGIRRTRRRWHRVLKETANFWQEDWKKAS